MRSKKGNTGFITIKVDLEETYNRLDWLFLKNTPKGLGLKSHFTSLIMHYVCTCNMRVIWNRELTKKKFPTKGIHLEDPLSPSLFVLRIQRLAQRVDLATSNKLWKLIKLVKNDIPTSHLFYINNLVYFVEASMK